MNPSEQLACYTREVEQVTETWLPKEEGYQKHLIEAMNHSMKAGGKRLRPLFMQEVYRLFGRESREVESFMVTIEMTHAFSLVHDDLPCMDNDEFRRGLPTTWVKYGYDTAVLTGDAPFIQAMETASKVFSMTDRAGIVGRCIQILSSKAGVYGMIGGQTVDVKLIGSPPDAEQLDFIFWLKTSALLEAPMMIDALLGGADEAQLKTVEEMVAAIGMAFQIQDDILDVTNSQDILDKPVGSDEKNNRTTYVSLCDLEQAMAGVGRRSSQTLECLKTLPGNHELPEHLIRPLVTKEKQREECTMILEKINGSQDIKKLDRAEIELLAQETRDFLIEKISMTGGHLASDLGVVELIMVIYLTFDLPKDKIIRDVGHQSYTHKILSGRRAEFDELHQYGGMSGFPKTKESPCDAFSTGYDSTSISAGLGMAQGRDLQGDDYTIVSVIGDGALTGGMAYETFNNAAKLKKNLTIVLNDNNMSISENVGGMSKYLSSTCTGMGYNDLKRNITSTLKKVPVPGEKVIDKISRTKQGIKQLIIPGMLPENMSLVCLGPVDGYNVRQLCKVLQEAKKLGHAVIIHVLTKKDEGYPLAERNLARFHGVESFDIESEKSKNEEMYPSYTDVSSKELCKLAEKDRRIVAVTAVTPGGTGLERFGQLHPNRLSDVGTTGEHAVTSVAGIAATGLKPVMAVYSSFLQRAYDQIVYDVCLQNLLVVFVVGRAGFMGSDGETHQGIFDLSYPTSIPNMCVLAPKNLWELRRDLRSAVEYDGPITVRCPRGEAYRGLKEFDSPIEYEKGEIPFEGIDMALLTVGSMVSTTEHVREKLMMEDISCTLVNGRLIKPIDMEMIDRIATIRDYVVTMGENVLQGGYGFQVTAYIHEHYPQVKVLNIALPDAYVEHGNALILREDLGIDSDSVIKTIKAHYLTKTGQKLQKRIV